MGSATRLALAGSRAALDAVGRVDLRCGEEVLGVARSVANLAHLRFALAEPEASAAQKHALLDRVYDGRVSATALKLVVACGAQQWSSQHDLVDGIEAIGFRVVAVALGDDPIDAELFALDRAIAGNAELQLALAAKLGAPAAKVALIYRILDGKVSPGTTAIAGHLVQQLRGRRLGDRIREAARVVADQRGFDVATVTSAIALTPAQLERLEGILAGSGGRDLRFDTIVDETVLGGIRVQLGDDVIDGSTIARLHDLRQRLAG